jgi:F-type H+-transporting ATPase subunit b
VLFPEKAYAAATGAATDSFAAGLGAVYPNPADIWPMFIAFGILFFLLSKYAFPMVINMLDSRSENIRESLEKAEQTKVDAERLMEEYKEQMALARQDASKVIEQGRKVADSMKDEIIAKANEEAVAIVAKAHEAMQAEKAAAVAELQGEVAALSVAVAGKLIGQRLSADDHASLIEQYVAEVGGLNDN